MSENKLIAEGWFDIERTKAVDGRILLSIESGQPIELSTGLHTDNENVSGEFNGVAYKAIARNYRPDHLAILPDETGACSIQDGCGVLINKKSETNLTLKESEMPKKKLVDAIIANGCSCYEETEREVLMNFEVDRLSGIANAAAEQEAQTDLVATLNEATKPFKVGDQTMTLNGETGKWEASKDKTNPKPAAPAKPAPVANVEPKAITVTDLPADVQRMVANAQRFEDEQRAVLIKAITDNKANVIKAEALADMNIEVLQGMAALAVNETEATTGPTSILKRSYFGQAVANGVPVDNEADAEDEDDDLLPLPTTNYAAAEA